MSAQRARIYVRLLAALSLSVLANIFFLQPKAELSGPAGSEASRASGGEARAMRWAAAAPAPKTRTPEQISESIRTIQLELKDRGHYPGQIDGRASLLTHAAILSYEQQNGYPITGEATEALVTGLIMGPAAMEASIRGGPGLVPGSAADRVVQEVRQLLTSLGYNAGRPDGRLSPELIRAIRAYESDNGLLPPTGRVTANLLLHLQRKAASFRPR